MGFAKAAEMLRFMSLGKRDGREAVFVSEQRVQIWSGVRRAGRQAQGQLFRRVVMSSAAFDGSMCMCCRRVHTSASSCCWKTHEHRGKSLWHAPGPRQMRGLAICRDCSANPPCRTSGAFSVALAYLDKALVVFGIHFRKVAAAVGSGHADVRYLVMSIGPATFKGLVTALQALKMVLEICT